MVESTIYLMVAIFQILILLGLVKLLDATKNSLLCAGIYTGIAFMFRISFGNNSSLFIMTAVIFLGSWLYFWLLQKLEGTGIVRFIVAVLGVAFGLL